MERKKLIKKPQKGISNEKSIIAFLSSYVAKLEQERSELKDTVNRYESEIWWLQTCSKSSLCPFCQSKVIEEGKKFDRTILSVGKRLQKMYNKKVAV